jgi:hypothetical protein
MLERLLTQAEQKALARAGKSSGAKLSITMDGSGWISEALRGNAGYCVPRGLPSGVTSPRPKLFRDAKQWKLASGKILSMASRDAWETLLDKGKRLV